MGTHLRLDIRTSYLPSTPNIIMKWCKKTKVFCSSPAKKAPRRRRAKNAPNAFFSPSPARSLLLKQMELMDLKED